MKRLFILPALVPLLASCVVAAAAGAGYIVSQRVLPGNVHVAEVALDVEQVWPSVQETLGFFQEPGSVPTVQDFPRQVQARVDGAKVVVEVEALDLGRTSIRVSAEKYLVRDSSTAAEVLDGILRRLSDAEDA